VSHDAFAQIGLGLLPESAELCYATIPTGLFKLFDTGDPEFIVEDLYFFGPSPECLASAKGPEVCSRASLRSRAAFRW
jgi:hypothetical protein